jgi:hypothetical protein
VEVECVSEFGGSFPTVAGGETAAENVVAAFVSLGSLWVGFVEVVDVNVFDLV